MLFRSDVRLRLGLDGSSRVLLFSTEGDTDPALYAKIVGRNADSVRGQLFRP